MTDLQELIDQARVRSNGQETKLPDAAAMRMTLAYQKKNLAPALKLNGTTIINFGEVFTLVGLPGQGKSAVCEALTATALGSPSFGLAFASAGKKILIMDTERTPDDVSDALRRIHRRADIQKDIERLDFFAVSELDSPDLLRKIVERQLATGDYELVILDGILDFSLVGLLDDKDAVKVIRWARSLAVKHNVALIATLHPNKGSENLPGHLGAFLYRWCRAILFTRPVKGQREVKELTAEPEMSKLSHGDVATLEPTYFTWDAKTQMLQPISSFQPREDRGKEERVESALRTILADGKRLRHSELVQAIESIGKSNRTAKRWIKEAVQAGYLSNTSALYSVVSPEVSLVSGPSYRGGHDTDTKHGTANGPLVTPKMAP